MARILIVEDEAAMLRNLVHIIKKDGHEVTGVSSGNEAAGLIASETYDAVLTDLRMDGIDGMQLLDLCKNRSPSPEVVVVTAYATITTAVKAIKNGAFEYIEKPFKIDMVRQVVRAACEKSAMRREILSLRNELQRASGQNPIVTQDTYLLRLLDTARQVAPTDCAIMITGESGTGKEMLARFVHESSRRRDKPFVAVNCGALTEDLLTNELFGHERGAYTGANAQAAGLIESADGGTLLLDEITEMSTSMQVRFLRFLQQREIMRLGGNRTIPVDVRIIATSNRDMNAEVRKGRFRHDLLYRINVVTLHLNRLKERPDDITLLAHLFLTRYSALFQKNVTGISTEAKQALLAWHYPGNVRELENIIERAVILCNSGEINPSDLPGELFKPSSPYASADTATLEQREKDHIIATLRGVGYNRSRAAKALGIDRVSLWRKIKRFGLENALEKQ